jgi:REP element-mobilizing transposase RayT
MPRGARIDAAGALHHVICRGIERRRVFRQDADREDFMQRLRDLLEETETICYAWALMPNHFHLLLRTGNAPLAKVLQRLLSGYVGAFNRRHGRLGQLFYNRYKSILCQEETYLLELVRYIHLNPLRAGLVRNLEGLDAYPFCGHGALTGSQPNDWQETDWILALFGRRRTVARRAFMAFMEKGVTRGKRPELTGGGLIRSLGGWAAVKSLRETNVHLKGDERILGDSEFVHSVLQAGQERMGRRHRLEAAGIDIEKAIERAACIFETDADRIRKPGKEPARVRARSVVCHWAVEELGMTTVAVSKVLGICPSAVTKAAARGRSIAGRWGVQLLESAKFSPVP